MTRRIAFLLPLLAAGCAAPDAGVSVRHVGSNMPYGDDGRLHLFVFDPNTPRPLSDRKRIARRAIRSDPACAWIEAPDAFLASETAKQGARYADTMLVAPLRCRS